MNNKKAVILGVLFLILSYLSLLLFAPIIENFGVTAMNGLIVPVCLTCFYLLFGLFCYHLIKAKVVCKPIRYIMYYFGVLATIGLFIFWLYMLFR